MRSNDFRAPLLGLVLLAAPLSLISAAGEEEAAADQEAIRGHIHAHAEGGKYKVYDPRAGEELVLELESVHSTAHPVASGEIFYCADFRGADGTLYDLDFYVERDPEGPVVVESLIHKAGGQDRLRPSGEDAKVEGPEGKRVVEVLEAAWREPVELHDPREGKELKLTLDHVHSTVKRLSDGSYFACVDAHDARGVLYDIDSYVLADEDGGMKVVESVIHKRDGKERLR